MTVGLRGNDGTTGEPPDRSTAFRARYHANRRSLKRLVGAARPQVAFEVPGMVSISAATKKLAFEPLELHFDLLTERRSRRINYDFELAGIVQAFGRASEPDAGGQNTVSRYR